MAMAKRLAVNDDDDDDDDDKLLFFSRELLPKAIKISVNLAKNNLNIAPTWRQLQAYCP